MTFNALKWAEKCFNSIAKANLLEHTIVVDNASTDATVDYLNSNFSELTILQQKENLGFGKGNNLGIEYAIKQGAKYLFLQNQDAYILPDTINRLVQVAKNNSDYGIISPIHYNTNGKLDHLFDSYLNESGVDLEKKTEIQPIQFCNAALWLVPTSTFEKIGGFDPIFPHYGEDKDFVNRVNYHKLKIGVCADIPATHDRDSAILRPVEQRKYFEYISYLVDLKNPTHHFKKTLSLVLSKIKKYIFLESIKLQISRRKLDIKHRDQLLKQLDQIEKHRDLCLQTGANFLNLK